MGTWRDHPPIVPIEGLNTKDPEDLVKPGEATVFRNVDTSGNSLAKRNGMVRKNTSGLPKACMILDRFHDLAVSHHADITLTDYWSVEIVLVLGTVDHGYINDGVTDTLVDSDAQYFTVLDKRGMASDLDTETNFLLRITNSDNGGNNQDQDEGASPASEGAFKVWFDFMQGGTLHSIHPTLSSNPGGSWAAIQPGQTYHIIVTRWDAGATDSVAIYVNGVSHGVKTGIATGTNDDTDARLKIGCNFSRPYWHLFGVDGENYGWESRPKRPFFGSINELRIRNATGVHPTAGSGMATYYATYGIREITSDDASDARFREHGGGLNILDVWGSLSFYLKLNEGTGTPSPTVGGSGANIFQETRKTCSWDDGLTHSDSVSTLRFDGGRFIIVPSALSYRRRLGNVDFGGGDNQFVRDAPDKATYRIRFKTPSSFHEDSTSESANPHQTLWYAGACTYWNTGAGDLSDAFFPHDNPNASAVEDNKMIWFWFRVREFPTSGVLQVVIGTREGSPNYFTAINGPTLEVDTEYCAVLTVDYTGSTPYNVDLWVIKDPDGTPDLLASPYAPAANINDRPAYSAEDDVNHLVMTIGGMPYGHPSYRMKGGETFSSAFEDPNAIRYNKDHANTKYPFLVDEVSIWNVIAVANTDDLSALASPLTAAQRQSYGATLLSHWSMNEGSGDFLRDTGSLGNHISKTTLADDVDVVNTSPGRRWWPLRPCIMATDEFIWGEALVTYADRSPIRFLRDYRRKNDDPLILVGGPSGLYKLDSGSLTKIYEGIDASTRHWQSFIFGDFCFIQIPGQAGLKAAGESVFSNGISPPIYGQDVVRYLIGGINVDNGRRINSSDGTAGAGGLLKADSTYLFAITYFSASTSIESAPGVILTHSTPTGDDDKAVLIGRIAGTNDNRFYLPKPSDPQVTHYRVYRSRANGSTLYFEQQYPIDNELLFLYKDDDDLGDPLDSYFNLKPQDFSMGTMFRGRAYYSGNTDNPQRLYVSIIGFPEYVPSTYFVDFVDDDGSGIPIQGLKALRDRVIVWTDQGSYLITDAGFDITLESSQSAPISVIPLQFDDGCVGRSAIAEVADKGVFYAGNKGIYWTTGEVPRSISDKIDPTYESFPKTESESWQMVHLNRKDFLLLAVAEDSSSGLNRIIVVDHQKRGLPMGVWHIPSITVMARVRNVTTKDEEIWVGDEMGYVHLLDSGTWDGGLSGVSVYSGTVVSGDTDDVELGVDYDSLAGDKLRGAELLVVHADGTKERRKIASQSTAGGSTTVTLVSSLDSGASAGDLWYLGAIDWQWKSGWMSLGATPFRMKRLHHINIGQVTQGTSANHNLTYQWREDASYATLGFANNRTRVAPGPLLGAGDRLQLSVGSDLPDAPAEIQYIDIGLFVKARRAYT